LGDIVMIEVANEVGYVTTRAARAGGRRSGAGFSSPWTSGAMQNIRQFNDVSERGPSGWGRADGIPARRSASE
jgi:hypothetical protein